MRNSSISVLIVGLLVGLFAIATTARTAEDPGTGKWKMDPAKSKYDPGPAPKSGTATVNADENNYKVDSHTVYPDGTETHIAFEAKTDGKDYPLTGVPTADKISVKRIDANTVETTWKKDGKTVMKTRGVVSNNGKTRTVTFDGTDAQGHKIHVVAVYDKEG